MTRAKAFDATKTDYVRSGPGRLKRLSVDKGLLRETEFVQKQIRALLRCEVSAHVDRVTKGFRALQANARHSYCLMSRRTRLV